MRYLFDTSALLAHYRQEAGWETIQRLFEDAEAELFLASVSLAEFGRRMGALGATEADVDETLANYELLFSEIVPIDRAVAKTAFAIGCRTPQRLPLVDALIAASAQVHNAILVHRDEHMRVIPMPLIPQLDLLASDH